LAALKSRVTEGVERRIGATVLQIAGEGSTCVHG
jgi:hypothetical protein